MKKGFSLTEIFLGLAIVLSISIGGFFLYNKVKYSLYTDETSRELNNMSMQALSIANSSGYDTVNSTGNSDLSKGSNFPHDAISTGLTSIETPSYASWNGRYYKSPYGGKISTWVYVRDTPSIFYMYEIRVEMADYDVKSCVNLMFGQLRRPALKSAQVGYGSSIFDTDKKGVRSLSDKKIQEKILERCEAIKNSSDEMQTLFFSYGF